MNATMAKTAKKPRSSKPAKASKAAGPAVDPDDIDGDSEGPGVRGNGKQLVIVESPAKAKTINKYLGGGYIVMASVGHVRDLPSKNPKGVKSPVPGVDLDHDFEPTYEIMAAKKKTVTDLKRAAKGASDIWFATDLDREGEAIAWHLAQALKVDPAHAKRVVFNAITKTEIQNAFSKPRPIDEHRFNAQQARRILDRIVGYQVSPLLWKKVAGGLSAGRVQSVAVRLVVDREREIMAFTPEEYWKITGYFTADLPAASPLRSEWTRWLAQAQPKPNPPGTGASSSRAERTIRERNGWLSEHAGLSAELIEIAGKRFEPRTADEAIEAVKLCGLIIDETIVTEDPKAKGPAAKKVNIIGRIGSERDWRIKSITTKRTKSRPYPPYITSTLQQAASNVHGFGAQTTMRAAQQLYEGVEIKGQGSIGLITYMRTDSTHLSAEALSMARGFIEKTYGPRYLPESPNFYKSSNKGAQEAHEAIRPTDVTLTPSIVRSSLDERQYKLYKLIWERFVSCQMTPAEWDSTAVLLSATVENKELVFKTTGRTLVFDGFYKAVGVPSVSDELTLPPLKEQQQLAALQIDPTQHFTSPPPRYSEASLVKKLEAEGIGRPSTYASIINVIQNRKYVDKQNNRFYATDMGMVVTDKLVEAFPRILDIGYTRNMESKLDSIEEKHQDWVAMLHEFYNPFKLELDKAHDSMQHAKAAMEPAPHKCPTCGSPTVYRFGKNGRFLSCSTYPDCKFAAPIDRDGNPMVAQLTDITCPICSSGMTKRTGRFGAFLGCVNYPQCKGIVNLDPKKGFVKLPKVPPLTVDVPCPKCQSPLNMRRSKRGPWLSCSKFPKCRGRMAWTAIEPEKQKTLEQQLAAHEKANPVPRVLTTDGHVIREDEQYVPKVTGGDIGGEAEAIDADAA